MGRILGWGLHQLCQSLVNVLYHICYENKADIFIYLSYPSKVATT